MKFQLPATVPLPASVAFPFTVSVGVPRLIACGKFRPARFSYARINAPGSYVEARVAPTAPNTLELSYDTPLLVNLVRIAILGLFIATGASVAYPNLTAFALASNDVLFHAMVAPPTHAMFLAFSFATRAATNSAPVRYVPSDSVISIAPALSFTPPTDRLFPDGVSTRNRAFLFFSDTLFS